MTPRPTPRTDNLPPEVVARVLMTISCTDTDDIAKVEGAGSIRQHGDQAVQVMHNGLLVEAGGYFGDWMAEIIRCLRGHHEPQEEVVFHGIIQRLLKDRPAAPAIVELGSFWAYYAMWFCSTLPGARALLMEPDGSNLDLGRRNFALNELTHQATFVEGVIGAEPGQPAEFTGEDGTTYQTEQFDLDSLMHRGGFDFADIVLSDIQGAESILLARARNDFAAGKVRFLVVSTHHHSISGSPLTHQNALTVLREAGGHVIAEHSVPESYSGDGLIAVSFDPRDKDFSIELRTARARESLFGELEWDLDAALRRLEAATQELSAMRARATTQPPSRSWTSRVGRRLRALSKR